MNQPTNSFDNTLDKPINFKSGNLKQHYQVKQGLFQAKRSSESRRVGISSILKKAKTLQ